MLFHKGAMFTAVGIDLPDSVADMFDIAAAIAGIEWPPKKGTRRNKGLVLLAGKASVDILSKCITDNCRDDSSRSDLEKFSKLWRTRKARKDNFAELYPEAFRFLLQPERWEQVRTVADVLLKERLLTYGEVKLCIESVVDEERKRDLQVYLELFKKTHRHRKPH